MCETFDIVNIVRGLLPLITLRIFLAATDSVPRAWACNGAEAVPLGAHCGEA